MCGSSTDFLAKAPYPLSKGRQVISGVHLQSVASSGPGCFFFVVAPFCSCPVSLVSRKFFAVGPGCAKVFFFVALRWAPRPFGAARAKKKNTTQGVFFFCSCPGERQGKEKPRAGAHRGFSFPCLSPGPQQKKHPGWCFFFALAPCWHGASPSLAFRRGRSKKKKNTLGGVFFLLRPRADAHSLTAGLGGDASPSPGWCFFFCCGPARTGLVFFFFAVAPPGRSLTHCGLGRFRQGPGGVFFFFAAAPAGLFRQ